MANPAGVPNSHELPDPPIVHQINLGNGFGAAAILPFAAIDAVSVFHLGILVVDPGIFGHCDQAVARRLRAHKVLRRQGFRNFFGQNAREY